MIKSSRSLATLALVLVAMCLVMLFIWWLVVYSPVGMRKAFEVMIGGDDMRSTFNTTFIVIICTALAGALFSFVLSGIKWFQGE